MVMGVNDLQQYSAWIGHSVIDSTGDKVGKVSQIYIDDQTGKPEWLAINTGKFKTRSSFVPLQGATADGDDLVIPFEKAKVRDAPQVEDDADGYLQPSEEDELYRYYGRSYPGFAASPENERVGKGTRKGKSTSDKGTDKAMTRSEEELRVGTERNEAGRARLRKYVVTEQVQTTVPISHEEVRVEREPITDANRDAALSGTDITESEHEVTLHEERPVVQKEVVPKERVRMDKETVTDEETVSEEIRKERIETEGNEHRR
jgi:uncharacterized protein (TIGR02271 family)